MAKDTERLRRIYIKTDGYCHICHKKLSFKNHGVHGAHGAWHIEHSKPKAKGGTNHLNNLLPACIGCNLDKGTSSSISARKKNGVTRAPLSKKRKTQIKNENTAAGAIIGGVIGMIGGPIGIAIGATIGGVIGGDTSPKK